jgi:ribonuclease Z
VKPTFHFRQVNGLFDDPVLYVRVIREGYALLFDSGEIYELNTREIHKIRHVFITHTHIDHFIGFDRLIRVLLGRETPLNVYGPRGIISSVKGKLSGYTWNLIEQYPLSIKVVELTEGELRCKRFSATRGFMAVDEEVGYRAPVIFENELFEVRAMEFDHGIPVLGYSVQEKEHLNVDTVRLERLGLKAGPWLGRLKQCIRQGKLDEKIRVTDEERVVLVREMLSEGVVRRTKGQKFSYIMDLTLSEENIRRAVDFVRNSDALFIESYFLEEDRQRALQRRHLTAAVAGMIARMASVKEVYTLHVSPKYRGTEESILKELYENFRH